MANIKISDLTAAAAASGTQEFEVNDSLTSKKVTGAQVLAYVQSNLTIQNNAVTTAKIADDNVTLAKLQDISTSSILGRTTAGTGNPEVLTGAQARTIVGADNASNLTSGTVGTARLASGTANSTTFLRGDQTWATVSGGVTSITAGNGLTGGTITSSGTIALDYYTGSTANNTSFPIGSYVVTDNLNSTPNNNEARTVYTNTNRYWDQTGGGGALAGTWRSRGRISGSGCGSINIMQRTA